MHQLSYAVSYSGTQPTLIEARVALLVPSRRLISTGVDSRPRYCGFSLPRLIFRFGCTTPIRHTKFKSKLGENCRSNLRKQYAQEKGGVVMRFFMGKKTVHVSEFLAVWWSII